MKQPCYYNHFYMHDEEGMVIYNALVNTKYYEEALKIPGIEDFPQGMKNREQVRIMKKYTAVGAIETQNKIIENTIDVAMGDEIIYFSKITKVGRDKIISIMESKINN